MQIKGLQEALPQTENSGRVRLGKPSPAQSKSGSPLARLRRWYRYSALKLLVLEGMSFPRRIQWIFGIRAVERGHGKASVQSWMNRVQVPVVYTVACSAHKRRMETLHPFLSIFDLFLLKENWMAGLEYGIRIGKLQSQARKANDTPTEKDTPCS